MDNDKRLERWVRQRLMASDDNECSTFVLRHVSASPRKGSGTDIFTFEAPAEFRDDAIKALVAHILETAELDAEGLQGVQSYVLVGKSPDGKARGRITMRVDSDCMHDDDGELSEPPTKTGSLQQQMRHNEVLAKALVGSQAQVLYAQTRIIEHLSRQNDVLMGGQVELVSTVQGLLTEQHERDEISRVSDAKVKGIEAGIDTLKTLGPIVARRLSKRKDRKALPAPDEPLKLIIQQLAGSLSSEQIEGIASQLKPEQQLGFLELMSAAQESKPTH